jgi:adenylylsulfate kinase
MTNGRTVWFVGLPCSGKTTLAKRLQAEGDYIHLDGDVLRDGLCSDLRFSAEDRLENLRRAAEVAELLNQQGRNVVASFITPSKDAQVMVQTILSNFITVYVKCPVEVCIERDVKGMYALAIEDKLPNFTGISAPFDEPETDITIPTNVLTEDESLHILIREILAR